MYLNRHENPALVRSGGRAEGVHGLLRVAHAADAFKPLQHEGGAHGQRWKFFRGLSHSAREDVTNRRVRNQMKADPIQVSPQTQEADHADFRAQHFQPLLPAG